MREARLLFKAKQGQKGSRWDWEGSLDVVGRREMSPSPAIARNPGAWSHLASSRTSPQCVCIGTCSLACGSSLSLGGYCLPGYHRHGCSPGQYGKRTVCNQKEREPTQATVSNSGKPFQVTTTACLDPIIPCFSTDHDTKCRPVGDKCAVNTAMFWNKTSCTLQEETQSEYFIHYNQTMPKCLRFQFPAGKTALSPPCISFNRGLATRSQCGMGQQ